MKNNSTKISIIVATYNSAATVSDTIESILSQTYTNIEVIVQDGLSKDNTLEIVASFKDERIKVVSEQDKGIYDAMNKGITRAKGDIIGILNSDDFYNSSQVLSTVMDTFVANNIDSVYGDLQYVDQFDTNKVVRNWKSGIFKYSNLKYGWMPPHPTLFLKKEVYENSGKFRTDFLIGADVEFILRILGKDKVSIRYIPEVLVKMRMGGVSNSSLKNRILLLKEIRKGYKINKLQYGFYTLPIRIISKIPQYFRSKKMNSTNE